MTRWLASIAIALLLALDLALPAADIGRRGDEAVVRAEATASVAQIGTAFPEVVLADPDGGEFRTSDLHGHATLLIFERSVDW